MIPENRFTDEVIQKRFEAYYGDSRTFSKGQIPYFREKLSSLSEFIGEIKERSPNRSKVWRGCIR